MFKELFVESGDTLEISKMITDQHKNLVNGGAKSNGIVTLYTKQKGADLKEFSVIYFVDEKGKPLTEKEDDAIMAAGGTRKRISYTIKKMKSGWKVAKNVMGAAVKENQKLTDDDVKDIINSIPFKG